MDSRDAAKRQALQDYKLHNGETPLKITRPFLEGFDAGYDALTAECDRLRQQLDAAKEKLTTIKNGFRANSKRCLDCAEGYEIAREALAEIEKEASDGQ